MIRETLKRTMASTFLVRVPDPSRHDFPMPFGSGFFVSPDGHFITANHVIKDVADPTKIELSHHTEAGEVGPILKEPEFVAASEEFDLAVLKFDFARHSNQEWAKGRDCFDFLEVDLNQHLEGTPVYSFGYPLSEMEVEERKASGMNLIVAEDWICPRVTSAIISSRWQMLGPVQTDAPSTHYVLDKAFNYGNSGGPIVLSESGKAIAVVIQFQPVEVPQFGGQGSVMVPSLYGIASALRNLKPGFKTWGVWK